MFKTAGVKVIRFSKPEIHRRIKKDLLLEFRGFNLQKYFKPMFFRQFNCYRCYFRFSAFAVIRHFQNPDHFLVQLFSYTLEKRFGPLIMLSFPPIRAQKSDPNKKTRLYNMP